MVLLCLSASRVGFVIWHIFHENFFSKVCIQSLRMISRTTISVASMVILAGVFSNFAKENIEMVLEVGLYVSKSYAGTSEIRIRRHHVGHRDTIRNINQSKYVYFERTKLPLERTNRGLTAGPQRRDSRSCDTVNVVEIPAHSATPCLS